MGACHLYALLFFLATGPAECSTEGALDRPREVIASLDSSPPSRTRLLGEHVLEHTELGTRGIEYRVQLLEHGRDDIPMYLEVYGPFHSNLDPGLRFRIRF